ncbi:MAG: dihydroneopterin triphosphate diphosphatase [Acidobacteriota bacterium]
MSPKSPSFDSPAKGGDTIPHKQPRSVQVVIFAETKRGREFLLLRRLESHGGFWQPVTGSLEGAETHVDAAVREVREETGINADFEHVIDLQLVNTFEIAPQWRAKYAPGVTHNEEVCFALRIKKQEVRIDPKEHDSWAWVDSSGALEMLYWESSKRALAGLVKMLG